MEFLRTPDECFDRITGFTFMPRYASGLPEFSGLRTAYIDEGPSDADVTWLCLHGEPTWSYLYRKMLPEFVKAGHRVIAPDFLGFGRSDKPTRDEAYTFEFHRNTVLHLIDHLDLKNIRLVCQDWGGLIGLTLPMSRPERFASLLVMNTMLGTGDMSLSEGFLSWRAYVRNQPNFDIAALMLRSTPGLTEEEAAAYAAPFPDERYRAGVRRFPELVPENTDAPGAALSRQARDWWKKEWRGKSLMAIGMKDPVLGPPVMYRLHEVIRGCPPPIELPEAGHFVQEWGQPIAQRAVIEFVTERQRTGEKP